jgi:hypothetical protein
VDLMAISRGPNSADAMTVCSSSKMQDNSYIAPETNLGADVVASEGLGLEGTDVMKPGGEGVERGFDVRGRGPGSAAARVAASGCQVSMSTESN